MLRKLMAVGSCAAALAFAGSASAAVYYSNLEFRDTGASTPTKSAVPYGVVTIEDGIDANAAHTGGTTLQITVTLNDPNSLFVNTGGPHDPFLYNLESPATVTVINGINQNFYDGGYSNPGTFEATPFGDFTSKVGCCSTLVPGQNVVSGFHYVDQTTYQQVIVGYVIVGHKKNGDPIYDKKQPIYGTQPVTTKVKVLDYTYVRAHYIENNGAANGIKGPLTFYLHDDNGLTFAGLGATFNDVTGKLMDQGSGNHLFSNKGNWWFSADICDAKAAVGAACTYNVAAQDAFRIQAPVVPEPSSWALMILGFGGAGAMLRRRRRTVATAA